MPSSTDATIFLIGADNDLTELAPTEFLKEDEFQALLAQYPPLLRMAAGSDGDLLLVAREAGVPDESDAADRWAVDHLFLNREGVPVLVEVKRASDTRARREVVAQMLDYASHGTVNWKATDLQAKYQETNADAEGGPDSALVKFLGDQDPENYWQQVEANLRAGRVRMLFVADRIGRELRRIVEFLNQQMRPAEVLAVEISQFKNASGVRMLVPRLFGATEQAASTKSVTNTLPARSNDEWLADYFATVGDQIGTIGRKLVDILIGAGLTMSLVPSQTSAVFKLDVQGHPPHPIFYVSPFGLAIWVRALREYPLFKTDESRAGVVKDIKTMGLKFRTDPPDPANSSPMVLLQPLTDEARLEKFGNYLLQIVKRAQSDTTSSTGAAPAESA